MSMSSCWENLSLPEYCRSWEESCELFFFTKQLHTKLISPKCSLGKLESKPLSQELKALSFQKVQSLDVKSVITKLLSLFSLLLSSPSETLWSLVLPSPHSSQLPLLGRIRGTPCWHPWPHPVVKVRCGFCEVELIEIFFKLLMTYVGIFYFPPHFR